MMTKAKTHAEEHRRREKRACTACGTKETVQWRKGARGECLCNACGVRFLRRGRKKEGEGTHQNDHFEMTTTREAQREGIAKKPRRRKKKKNTTKGKKMKMDDTEWTKEMDEYRASLIAGGRIPPPFPKPRATAAFRIQDLIENAPNHAAAPEIINSIEKERIQQTYWLNEDEVSEKSV